MKTKTSVIIGMILLMIAGIFIAFAMQHPELSFPWSQRVTFMLYGSYLWFVFKFLISIPVFNRKQENTEKKENHFLQVIIYFIMAVVFFLMEITGDKVTVYTIIRGFIVIGSFDVAIENLRKMYHCKGVVLDEKK